MAADSEIPELVRSMVEANGADALAIARSAARNQRRQGRTERADWWLRVVAAIEGLYVA